MEGSPGASGGQRDLGLPAQGRGSRAGLGRRVVGLAVDWALASLISAAFFAYDAMATLAVFALSTALLVSTAGFTIGHRLAGVQVVRLVDLGDQGRPAAAGAAAPTTGRDGGAARRPWAPPGILLGCFRTLLLCLVVPAVVWDSSGRGLHDVAAGTVVVRR